MVMNQEEQGMFIMSGSAKEHRRYANSWWDLIKYFFHLFIKHKKLQVLFAASHITKNKRGIFRLMVRDARISIRKLQPRGKSVLSAIHMSQKT